MTNPEKLSDELRRGDGDFMRNRRGIIGLAMVASGSMALIALYQTGILRRVPEPRWRLLDAEKINASPQAYRLLDVPDAILGLGSYAATMGLAAMDGKDRHRTHPWIPIALGAKVLFDAANAGRLAIEEWTENRAFCLWCLLAVAATFATVPLAYPEARAALRARPRPPAPEGSLPESEWSASPEGWRWRHGRSLRRLLRQR